ncbi:MAG: hypothetical protein ISR65_13930 [Bacteriovoracaceae bacterium]|nr:hypothetical protein [Bacteriovoracaceae bacterium]
MKMYILVKIFIFCFLVISCEKEDGYKDVDGFCNSELLSDMSNISEQTEPFKDKITKFVDYNHLRDELVNLQDNIMDLMVKFDGVSCKMDSKKSQRTFTFNVTKWLSSRYSYFLKLEKIMQNYNSICTNDTFTQYLKIKKNFAKAHEFVKDTYLQPNIDLTPAYEQIAKLKEQLTSFEFDYGLVSCIKFIKHPRNPAKHHILGINGDQFVTIMSGKLEVLSRQL